MANRPVSSPLPADLPQNWQVGQIVSPSGTDVGLTAKHGYNYLQQQVNAAQTATNAINAAFDNLVDVNGPNQYAAPTRPGLVLTTRGSNGSGANNLVRSVGISAQINNTGQHGNIDMKLTITDTSTGRNYIPDLPLGITYYCYLQSFGVNDANDDSGQYQRITVLDPPEHAGRQFERTFKAAGTYSIYKEIVRFGSVLDKVITEDATSTSAQRNLTIPGITSWDQLDGIPIWVKLGVVRDWPEGLVTSINVNGLGAKGIQIPSPTNTAVTNNPGLRDPISSSANGIYGFIYTGTSCQLISTAYRYGNESYWGLSRPIGGTGAGYVRSFLNNGAVTSFNVPTFAKNFDMAVNFKGNATGAPIGLDAATTYYAYLSVKTYNLADGGTGCIQTLELFSPVADRGRKFCRSFTGTVYMDWEEEDARGPKVTNATLLAASWNGTTSWTYSLFAAGAIATDVVMLGLSASSSPAQLKEFSRCGIILQTVNNDSVILAALLAKPTIDLPITLTNLGRGR